MTLAQGATLTFTNLDAVAHNVASVAVGDGRAAAVRVSERRRRDRAIVEGTERLTPGTYDFLCTVHPSMTGKLEVQ